MKLIIKKGEIVSGKKKEVLKTTIIVIIVILVVIYNFAYKKNKDEEYEDLEIINNENISNTEVREEVDKIKVYVTGEVKFPGVIELESGARIEDAINLAGGTTDKSDLSLINLAYSLEDGEKLYIPNLDENFKEQYITKENAEGIVESTNSDNKSKININTGDISELSNLPGVGSSLAQKIITYRQTNGKFKTIEDLKNVSGIGDKKYESLKEYICVK